MLLTHCPNVYIRKLRRIHGQLRHVSTYSDNSVITQEIGKTGIITLNRAKGLNVINYEVISTILETLRKWESTQSLVIIKGTKKVFSAGGDVVRLSSFNAVEDAALVYRTNYTTNYLIGTYKIPYVALISGITMGGGVGLSVHSHYRVATETTTFAMPEAAIGLFPDVGSSYFLPRMHHKMGYYFGLTGFRLKGKDVRKAGIATHLIESDRLGELEERLIKCQGYTDVDKVLKETCVEDNSEFVLQKYLPQIEKCFSGKTVEEIIENLERDGSDWATSTLNILAKISPTSLKVTLRQLQLGARMNLDECLKMELRMAIRHIEKSDGREGIRALLIDKDQNPQWSPKTVGEVTDEMVNFYFRPLSDNVELKLDVRN